MVEGGSVVGRSNSVYQNPGVGEGMARPWVCGGSARTGAALKGSQGERRPQREEGPGHSLQGMECPARTVPDLARGRQGPSSAGKGCGQRSLCEAPCGQTRASGLEEGKREQGGCLSVPAPAGITGGNRDRQSLWRVRRPG